MKKIKILVIFILISTLIWYLFFKQHDYIVQFEIKTSPGTLFSSVEEWNLSGKEKGIFTYSINEKKPFTYISQTIEIDNINMDLDWEFKSINDSLTKVVVGITEKENSIYNRITVPFSNTLFKNTSIEMIKGYKTNVEFQLKHKFKVTYAGIDTIPEMKYAYIQLKNINMRDKAEEMMKNDAMLLEFMTKYNLKDGNFPFLIIDKWNLNENTIDFRFCFPAKQNDSLSTNGIFKFDILKPKKALKAIYNGNYITSDRAWFALYEYAKRYKIQVENNPIEFFYNNPFNGGDELKWKAEVYLPIK